MIASRGVGLAAPQVGRPLRVIVVLEGEGPLPIVNPEIVRGSGESVAEEGCLSLPFYYGMVNRHEKVTVKGLDARGRPFRRRFSGLVARAVQHEIDHLNGIVFKDRLVEGAELRFAPPEAAAARSRAAP